MYIWLPTINFKVILISKIVLLNYKNQEIHIFSILFCSKIENLSYCQVAICRTCDHKPLVPLQPLKHDYVHIIRVCSTFNRETSVRDRDRERICRTVEYC